MDEVINKVFKQNKIDKILAIFICLFCHDLNIRHGLIFILNIQTMSFFIIILLTLHLNDYALLLKQNKNILKQIKTLITCK